MVAIRHEVDLPQFAKTSEAEYHNGRRLRLTSHSLADFRKCPKLFWMKRQGLVTQPDSEAFAFGRAAHKKILEGNDQFREEYVISDGPINEKTGKPFGKTTNAYAGWMEEQTKEVISSSDYIQIDQMHDQVLIHRDAEAIISATPRVVEGALFGDHHGMTAQSRLDLYADGCLVDLKTCKNIDFFESDARSFGYLYQMAFYRHMCLINDLPVRETYLIAVEKFSPFRAGVWRLPERLLIRCDAVNKETTQELLQAVAANEWPTRFEGVKVFTE